MAAGAGARSPAGVGAGAAAGGRRDACVHCGVGGARAVARMRANLPTCSPTSLARLSPGSDRGFVILSRLRRTTVSRNTDRAATSLLGWDPTLSRSFWYQRNRGSCGRGRLILPFEARRGAMQRS